MIRTQIYLPRPLSQAIENEASRTGKPKAQVIRELLTKSLSQAAGTSAGDALLRLADLGTKLQVNGPSDLSTNLDNYLYEK